MQQKFWPQTTFYTITKLVCCWNVHDFSKAYKVKLSAEFFCERVVLLSVMAINYPLFDWFSMKYDIYEKVERTKMGAACLLNATPPFPQTWNGRLTASKRGRESKPVSVNDRFASYGYQVYSSFVSTYGVILGDDEPVSKIGIDGLPTPHPHPDYFLFGCYVRYVYCTTWCMYHWRVSMVMVVADGQAPIWRQDILQPSW